MICGPDIKFPRNKGFVEAEISWDPLMWLNTAAGTPTTREPSINRLELLLIWEAARG